MVSEASELDFNFLLLANFVKAPDVNTGSTTSVYVKKTFNNTQQVNNFNICLL